MALPNFGINTDKLPSAENTLDRYINNPNELISFLQNHLTFVNLDNDPLMAEALEYIKLSDISFQNIDENLEYNALDPIAKVHSELRLLLDDGFMNHPAFKAIKEKIGVRIEGNEVVFVKVPTNEPEEV